ncbi:MAG: TadE/TadG family type IV pilus assembly protein [Pyrinomonadaceae bacterium]
MVPKLRDAIKNFLRRENGTQMIEFAIIFPVLILLFAGTTELGRLFYTYTSLAKATRAGARYLSTVPNVTTSTTAGKNIVLCGNAAGCGGAGQPAVILPNLTATNIVVTPPATVTGVKYVTVEITGYNYQPLVFNLGAMTGGNINIPLTPRTRMRYMVR